MVVQSISNSNRSPKCFLVNHQPKHPLGEHGADDAEYLGGGVEETAGRALRLGIRDLRRELKANG